MKYYLIAIMHYDFVVKIIGGTTDLNKATSVVSKIIKEHRDDLDVNNQIVRYITIPEKVCESIANKWNKTKQAEFEKFLEED